MILSIDELDMIIPALCKRAGSMSQILYMAYNDVLIHGKEENRGGRFVNEHRAELERIDRHARLLQRLIHGRRDLVYAMIAASMTHSDLSIEEAEMMVGLVERNTRTEEEERDMGDME